MKTLISLLICSSFSHHVRHAFAACSVALMASSEGHACDNANGLSGLKAERHFLRQSERMAMKEEEAAYVHSHRCCLLCHTRSTHSRRFVRYGQFSSLEETEGDKPETEPEEEKYVPVAWHLLSVQSRSSVRIVPNSLSFPATGKKRKHPPSTKRTRRQRSKLTVHSSSQLPDDPRSRLIGTSCRR
jgi:hypothetical protein